MPFLIYFFVLLITAGSVVFGLDWLSAPMSPMPTGRPALHAAVKPAPRAESGSTKVIVKTAPNPVQTVSPPSPPPEQAAVAPPPAPEQPNASAIAPAPQPAETAAAVSPKCDVDACANAYRSFRAEDCTYQPSNGPRRLCTKGAPQKAAADAASAPDAQAQAACNIAACSQAYHSFTASDCTYQPLTGARRICEK